MTDKKASKNNRSNQEEMVHMNFLVSSNLRNAFMAKVVGQGKTAKEVFTEFMKEYIKKS